VQHTCMQCWWRGFRWSFSSRAAAGEASGGEQKTAVHGSIAWCWCACVSVPGTVMWQASYTHTQLPVVAQRQ
jgi:hypothetical protein